jgi:hypothetical protein
VLTEKGGNNCDLDIDGQHHSGAATGSDDKENKRWYSQELGLNLWQTTLGAAALLGTGFGSGYVCHLFNRWSLFSFLARLDMPSKY